MLLPKGITALRNVAHPEKTRYAMNGVLIERNKDGNVSAVATDGKALAFVSWHEDTSPEMRDVFGIPTEPRTHAPFRVIVPADALKTAEKGIPSKKAIVSRAPYSQNIAIEETSEGDSFRLATHNGEGSTVAGIKPVDGYFPPYEEVLEASTRKAKASGIRIALNVEILYRLATSLATAAESLGADIDAREPVIVLEMSGPADAVVVRLGAGGSRNLYGVIMPVNVEGVTGKEWGDGQREAFNAPPVSALAPIVPPVPAVTVPSEASSPQNPATAESKPETTTSKPARKGVTHAPSVTGSIGATACGRKVPSERISPDASFSCLKCHEVKGKPAPDASDDDIGAFGTLLALSADSRETLRACDVDRVMTAAHIHENRETSPRPGFCNRFRNWLIAGFGSYLPGTCSAVLSWNPGTDETTPQNPAPSEPARLSVSFGGVSLGTVPLSPAVPSEPATTETIEPAPSVQNKPESTESKPAEPVTLEIREPRTGAVESITFQGTDVVSRETTENAPDAGNVEAMREAFAGWGSDEPAN